MHQDGNVYAIFKMREWAREMSPLEIFYDLDSAKKFMTSVSDVVKKNFPDVSELKIFERSKTDWIPCKSI